MNDGRGNDGINVGIEGLEGIEREKAGKETGGVGGSHGGTGYSIVGGIASNPGGENVHT